MNEPNWTTYPWIVDMTESGKNWTVCTVGTSNVDGCTYEVTTDRVHASELAGDARDDAYLIACAPELYNSLQALCEVAIAKWFSLSADDKVKVETAKNLLSKARGE
jgi:hypothetical protein